MVKKIISCMRCIIEKGEFYQRNVHLDIENDSTSGHGAMIYQVKCYCGKRGAHKSSKSAAINAWNKHQIEILTWYSLQPGNLTTFFDAYSAYENLFELRDMAKAIDSLIDPAGKSPRLRTAREIKERAIVLYDRIDRVIKTMVLFFEAEKKRIQSYEDDKLSEMDPHNKVTAT
jgi:hypothetical protein